MNVPWVTLFKKCLRNFDPSINMARLNGSFLHYTDMKKFLMIAKIKVTHQLLNSDHDHIAGYLDFSADPTIQ